MAKHLVRPNLPPIRDLSEVLARVPLPSSEWLGV